jgi:hypothetical protein
MHSRRLRLWRRTPSRCCVNDPCVWVCARVASRQAVQVVPVVHV